MKLKVTEIPENLKNVIPPGFKLVRRSDHEFLVVEALFCRHGHSLLVDHVKIHGKPSIMLKAAFGSKDEGVMFVDAFWGSHAKLFSFLPSLIEDELLLEAYCPTCGISLMEESTCHDPGCSSTKGIVLYLPGNGNTVHVCARVGCPEHFIEIVDVPHEYIEMISDINYFGEHADDLFGEML